jgi:hypothetical protein
MVQRQTLEQIHLLIVESLPVQLVKSEIIGEIDSGIGSCGSSPASVLELLLVNIDWVL